jgi:predicted O-methyltransferase YrrM
VTAARKIVRNCLPSALLERYRVVHLKHRARLLSDRAGRAGTVEERSDAIYEFDEFRPYQKRSELVAFLRQVATLRPAAICEIGAASGGTLCALSHAAAESAVVISIDLQFTAARLEALPKLGRRRQTVSCIAGDSHHAGVYARVVGALGRRKLDLLFIDGDHSYSGVGADFVMYRDLVRPGGLIGFHDIIPDFKTRFGTPTAADSGGVPEFWDEIRRRYTDTQEIVESRDQDGYGIGLLTWPG